LAKVLFFIASLFAAPSTDPMNDVSTTDQSYSGEPGVLLSGIVIVERRTSRRARRRNRVQTSLDSGPRMCKIRLALVNPGTSRGAL